MPYMSSAAAAAAAVSDSGRKARHARHGMALSAMPAGARIRCMSSAEPFRCKRTTNARRGVQRATNVPELAASASPVVPVHAI